LELEATGRGGQLGLHGGHGVDDPPHGVESDFLALADGAEHLLLDFFSQGGGHGVTSSVRSDAANYTKQVWDVKQSA
jgi:hypothetical protein